MGKPGSPSPLFESLCLRETVMRMAHHAAMKTDRERGRDARAMAPRARCRPPPGPSPAGGGNPAPPPSGGRLGGGLNAVNDGHLSRPCGCAAPRRDEHPVVPGRAAPSQTLPRVGTWGNRVSPCPCGAGGWGNRVSPPPLREPMFTLGPMRMAHTARCNRPGSAGVPPSAHLRGQDARAPSLCSR